MKRFLALLLALALAVSLTACSTQPKPFYTDAEDVPASDLEKLPTDEVLRAVLEYPEIINIFLYSSDKWGVEQTAVHCTALKVFLTRPDARQVLDETIADPAPMQERMQTDDNNKEMMPYVLRIISNAMDEMGK